MRPRTVGLRASMLTAYRRILAVPGALLFSATGLVGRLPISMQGLGIVLLVVDVTGSYALRRGGRRRHDRRERRGDDLPGPRTSTGSGSAGCCRP